MKGFLKRDFYLLLPNLRFYAVFILIMGGVSLLRHTSMVNFFGFYVAIFAASSVLGLFSYDDMNHWQTYAAAAPHGRRGQVDGRYVIALLLGAGVMVTISLLYLLGRDLGQLSTALLYGGMFLVYVDLAIPIGYRFGSNSRTVMVIIIGALAAIGGMVGTMATISGSFSGSGSSLGFGIPLALIGLAGTVVSRWVSLGIMAKKEL